MLSYQGESNVEHAGEYAELFKTMIRSWREGFGQGDVPFYFVQLANFGDEAEFADRGWARLREAQEQALALPDTGMAVTIDIGEAHNIHPRNKQEVGRRLALIARAKVYGLPPEVSGPRLRRRRGTRGSAMRVRFTHVGDELQARGGEPTALELAGADKVFHPANGDDRDGLAARVLPRGQGSRSRCATHGRTPRARTSTATPACRRCLSVRTTGRPSTYWTS